jgi:2-keto-4-pentenoate hydratase/2-oxohepta-3-ene-1,7-dioic acid hydratase in catechol pathway
MRLLRYGPRRQERPGLLDPDGIIRDLSAHVADITPAVVEPSSLARLRSIDPASLPAVRGVPRFGACISSIPKIVCAGLNYFDHAREASLPIPAEPFLFLKAISAVNGPNDDIVLPPGSVRCDWETELAMVIGTRAQNVAERDALEHVAGYCILNDVAEREFQFERGEPCFAKGKSADTFAPLGPYLVTADEIADPQSLAIFLELNGKRMQDGSTRDMIFKCAWLVSYVSAFMSLNPGDIVSTGTPAGTNTGLRPQRYLRAGDELRLGVEGLGEQRAHVVASAVSSPT